jgi:cysteine desulfurase/selenocysteine lyase
MSSTLSADQDVTRWRAETPGCATVVHFNHAGSSLPPAPVTSAVVEHLRHEERIGGYEAADAAYDRLEAVYTSVARLIGADAAEIALVENATRAWDMAFYAVPFQPGDRIITGVAEYASNYLAFLHLKAVRGVEIAVAPDDATGATDVEALEALIDDRTRLIAITHVPTDGGLVNPAERIGEVARRHRVLYLLDACQSVGQLNLDVRRIGCDYVAGRLGLGVAVDYALGIGMDRIEDLVGRAATGLRNRLAEVPAVTVRDKGTRRSGIVTFQHANLDATTIQNRLRAHGINVSVTEATSTRLDFEQRGLPDLVRASVHYFTTDEELDRLVDAVRGLDGVR